MPTPILRRFSRFKPRVFLIRMVGAFVLNLLRVGKWCQFSPFRYCVCFAGCGASDGFPGVPQRRYPFPPLFTSLEKIFILAPPRTAGIFPCATFPQLLLQGVFSFGATLPQQDGF